MFDREQKKSCWAKFVESHKATPYKINWNNKNFGAAWFYFSTNIPHNYCGYGMILMGMEGLIRGWKMDLSDFDLNSDFKSQGYINFEEGNKIVESLKKYYIQKEIYVNDPRISKKDLDKYTKLNDLCWENPVTRQGKRECFFESELEFLDQ